MTVFNTLVRMSVRTYIGRTALAMLLICAGVCVQAQSDDTQGYNIIYSGFGIYQHPENVKMYGVDGVKNWFQKDLPDLARIALPEPNQLPKTETECFEYAVALGKQLAQLMRDRRDQTQGKFEIQTLQHSGALAYALQGFGKRRDLVQWQEMCVTAMQTAKDELGKTSPIHVNAVVGSNDTHTLSKALLGLDRQPFDTITMDSGRAFVSNVVQMASKFKVPTTLVTINGDYPAFLNSIGNRDGTESAQRQSPYIQSVELNMGSHTPGSRHIGMMMDSATILSAELVDSSGRRELPRTRDAILQEAWRPAKLMSTPVRETGGIDLADMRLTYVQAKSSASAQGGSGELFRAPFSPADSLTHGVRERADELRAAFRLGLVLSPDNFWVNLNPSEPDRITSRLLALTDTGKALLEADLQLKKDTSSLTDPRTSGIGREYWKRLAQLTGGSAIRQTMRCWIVPGTIQIDTDGALLYSDLAVRSEAKHLSGGRNRASLPESEKLFEEMILPELEQRVNSAPEYAALRRVYSSLILARWYRERYKGTDAPLAQLIDSENMEGLQSHSKWSPRNVFDRYLESVKHGDYSFEERTEEVQGPVHRISISRYFSGGVDFTGLAIPPASKIDGHIKQVVQSAWKPEGVSHKGELWFTDISPNRLGVISDTPHGNVGGTLPGWRTLLGLFVAGAVASFALKPRRRIIDRHR